MRNYLDIIFDRRHVYHRCYTQPLQQIILDINTLASLYPALPNEQLIIKLESYYQAN